MNKKLALITGGSAGIGLEMAHILASKGYDLILSGRSDRTHSVAEELRAFGVSVTPVQSDLATKEGNSAVLEASQASGRPLDVLIINAGIAVGGKTFTEISLDQHLDLVATNITSPLRLLHGLVPNMAAAGGGRILLVSSLSAITPTPYEGAYGPSKSFLTSFGHGLREELAGTGITITILHPGAVATEFHARAGMGDTRFGDNSWKNDPALVAQQGIDAMLRGETSLIGGDEDTQEVGALLRSMRDEDKARRQAREARPQK